jgi:hypothetical protein
LIAFWLKSKGKMQGDNFQLDKEPLLKIPIYEAKEEVQQIVAKIVEYIIHVKKSNIKINAFTTNDALSLMFENVIDAIIYELYFKEELEREQLDVIDLVKQSITNVSQFSNINEQINKLFSEWNNYENKLRNRMILQKTRSENISSIEKSLINE